ncbi:MAG: hypothetical protein WAK60_03525 [Sedimentisphaerales bacterium]
MDKPNSENVQESLAMVDDVMVQTRKAIASTYANPLLILWGIIWVAAFTATHFYLNYAGYIFTALDIVGCIGTFIILWIFHTKPSVRTQGAQKKDWHLLWFWLLLFTYVFIWLEILAPFNGLQLNAVFSTAAMFAYTVIGLRFNSYFMVWLGLAVTATTLIGFYFLQHYYCLWMAFTGGGAILCTGLYIRFRWR